MCRAWIGLHLAAFSALLNDDQMSNPAASEPSARLLRAGNSLFSHGPCIGSRRSCQQMALISCTIVCWEPGLLWSLLNGLALGLASQSLLFAMLSWYSRNMQLNQILTCASPHCSASGCMCLSLVGKRHSQEFLYGTEWLKTSQM